MAFLYVIIVIIAIILSVVISSKFQEIAEMKGHSGGPYFWFTFFFGIIGMLMVVALPDHSNKTTETAPVTFFQPKQEPDTRPIATVNNPNKESVPISAELKNGEKVCPKCGTAQKADRHVCWSCGQQFDN